MAEEQQFCLRWNNFQANITSQFESLRNEEDFVDVTLACEGNRLRAHKVVLSACSPYFRELFKTNPCKHPILFMRDVEFVHLKSLVEFMYAGEVNVAQAELSTFLRTAESLQIRGLTEAPQKHKEKRKQTVDSSAIATGSLKNNSKNTNGKTTSSDSSIELDDDVDLLPLSPQLSPRPAKKCKFEDRLGPDTSIHLNSITNNSVSDNRYHSNNFSSQENSRHEQENIYKDNADLLEPKIEVPDYSSDGESKSGTYYGLDNSIDMTSSFNNIQGNSSNFELLPAGSSGNLSTPSDTSPSETNQADQRKLHSLDPRPCPICNRMYSNLSNLRQHVRLIHNPQTVACPLCSKPFKTKLYLKRHLISFHELVCTNPTGANNNTNGGGNNNTPPSQQQPQQVKTDFYPPPPQVYLGQGNDSNANGAFEGTETFAAKSFVESTNNSLPLKENKQGE